MPGLWPRRTTEAIIFFAIMVGPVAKRLGLLWQMWNGRALTPAEFVWESDALGPGAGAAAGMFLLFSVAMAALMRPSADMPIFKLMHCPAKYLVKSCESWG
jgi:hypothetical protein